MDSVLLKYCFIALFITLINYKVYADEEWNDLFCNENALCQLCENKILSIENVSKNCLLPSFQEVKQYCCQTWSAYSCRDSAAKTVCTESEYQKYKQHWNRMAAHLYAGAPCGQYPFGSDKCKSKK